MLKMSSRCDEFFFHYRCISSGKYTSRGFSQKNIMINNKNNNIENVVGPNYITAHYVSVRHTPGCSLLSMSYFIQRNKLFLFDR